MVRHPIDRDEEGPGRERAELSLTTGATADEALRPATGEKAERVVAALDALAAGPHDDREDGWR